jgi:hypothetical protein
MLGSYFVVIWLASFLLEVYVVVRSVYRRDFVSELPINIYMLSAAGVTGGMSFCFYRFGYHSVQYGYYYYYTDSLLTILMFWVVIHFYQEVFKEMRVSRYVRVGAMLLLVATAFFSYLVVHQNRTSFHNHLTSRLVVEIDQNLYFIGVVLTYLLWGALVKLRESRTRLVQLVLALGVYFSASAGSYAIGNLFPHLYLPFLRYLLPVIGGLWLPAAWAYTFTRVPDNARMVAGALLARAR